MIKETKISKFDGGMQTDTRRNYGARLIKNFDILSFPRKLKPHNSSESGNDTSSRNIVNFLTVGSTLYGLGVSTGFPDVWSKTDFTDGSWNDIANSTGNAARDTTFFTFYKSAIYGAQGGNSFWKFLVNGGGFTNTDLSVTYTSMANGIVHSKDDILYVGYDNIIAKNNAGTWTAAALTLSADVLVKSICEFGNYLAIGCTPLSSAGRPTSRVYLWDRDSSLTTLSESIDWEDGTLVLLEEYEGGLLGISTNGNKLIIKFWNGAFQKIGEVKHLVFEFDVNSSINFRTQKQKKNNRIYFAMDVTLDNSTTANNQFGVWSVGRNSDGQFALALEHTPNNDTDPNSTTGFHIITDSGIDYTFISYIDSSSNPQVSKTNNSVATAYAHTSTFKTQIFDADDASLKKKLVRVKVNTEPVTTLLTLFSYTLAYRKDQETSYTTILTNTVTQAGSFTVGLKYTIVTVGSTDFTAIGASANTVGVEFVATGVGTGSGYAMRGIMSHSAINIESSGATFPEYNEIQFQITSTGGATITGFLEQSEILDKTV